MEKTFQLKAVKARFAANNINILDVSLVGEEYVVRYEFQWRDPHTRTPRWCKTFATLNRDYVDSEPYRLYRVFADTILSEVTGAREILENGENK